MSENSLLSPLPWPHDHLVVIDCDAVTDQDWTSGTFTDEAGKTHIIEYALDGRLFYDPQRDEPLPWQPVEFECQSCGWEFQSYVRVGPAKYCEACIAAGENAPI